jgi:DNA-binding CsgD family transcriptional regulator
MNIAIRLSPRERQVILCRARGLPYKTAAEELGITAGTFKHYLLRSFEKLQARSSIEAVRNLQLFERGEKPSKKTSRRIPVLC